MNLKKYINTIKKRDEEKKESYKHKKREFGKDSLDNKIVIKVLSVKKGTYGRLDIEYLEDKNGIIYFKREIYKEGRFNRGGYIMEKFEGDVNSLKIDNEVKCTG